MDITTAGIQTKVVRQSIVEIMMGKTHVFFYVEMDDDSSSIRTDSVHTKMFKKQKIPYSIIDKHNIELLECELYD